MQIGFVSAALADLSLEEVLVFAAEEGFGCVELMCWPPGRAERRYAGVTHIDVSDFTDDQAGQVRKLVEKHGVAISALGYYPNPLDPDPEYRQVAADHLKKVIRAAPKLGVTVVTTFIGRDYRKSVEDNWPLVREVWPSIVDLAESVGVKIGLENCPMLYSQDEWPGGKNLATTPANLRKLFEIIPSPHLGLNFDPSHLIWQQIDYARATRDFGSRIVHAHAKDTYVDADKLYEEGILGLGWHKDKLPGLGQIDWQSFFGALSDTGFNGAVCIEAEDRAFEGSVADRKRGLRQSKRFLDQYVS